MCRRVVVDGYGIGCLGNDFSILGCYDGSEGAAPGAHAVLAQGDGSAHELFFVHDFCVLCILCYGDKNNENVANNSESFIIFNVIFTT